VVPEWTHICIPAECSGDMLRAGTRQYLARILPVRSRCREILQRQRAGAAASGEQVSIRSIAFSCRRVQPLA
jgi:hypothetical protein